MKKFILFLLLVVTLSLGLLAFLLRNDFQKISENRNAFASTLRNRVDEAVYTYAPRPVRLFLFKNMPGIFPVTLVCEHRPAEGVRVSLFSGDQLDAGGSHTRLFCPNGLELGLFPGTQIRLMPRAGQPGIQLIQGQLNVNFRENPPIVHSDLFSFTFTGQPAGNRLNVVTTHDGFIIGCLNGVVKGKVESSPMAEGKKNFLLSRDCLFSLRWSPTLPEKHLLPGDALAFHDLEKGRREWAAQDQSTLLGDLGVDQTANPGIIARIDPVPSSRDTVKLIWQANIPPGPANCTLYTQDTARSPAQAAHKFQGDASAGELTLLKGFLKFWMSLSCNNGVQSFTSNVLAPLQ